MIYLQDKEQELFHFDQGQPGVITEQWFSVFGGAHPYDGGADPTIRIYVDGAGSAPALEYRWRALHDSIDTSSLHIFIALDYLWRTDSARFLAETITLRSGDV